MNKKPELQKPLEFKDLIGKKILCFRGIETKGYNGKKVVPLSYILFDDKETILELSEQDYYSYHDCASWAREISLRKDKNLWDKMFKEDWVKESTQTGAFPFL